MIPEKQWRIHIPKGIAEWLGQYEPAVRNTLEAFDKAVLSDPPIFFPEYSDHGPDHISEVLATAEFLIGDSLGMLNNRDAAVLVLSILLHDIGMHLQPDGLIQLVKSREESDEDFGDRPWADLWDEYTREAKRITSQKRMALYGHTEAIKPPDLDKPRNWTKDQDLMIGEFIRRHHPRIAFEVARNGFPGPPGANVTGLTDARLKDIRSLIGLVARSHGLGLRRCVDYLRKQYYGDAVGPRGVHAVYLMAVLRIADYFQLHAERADATRLRTQSLRSPISIKEWEKHAAMLHLGPMHDDPEAINAELAEHVEPDTYFALRDLFEHVQGELDHTWAVLGEVYGLHETDGLNKLRLRTRRVFTNLAHPDFVKKLAFLPYRANFEAANRRLLPLLAKPLYGDQPGIAIRELVQNAVDAVLELEEHCKKEGIDPASLNRNRLEADVVVAVNALTGEVIVSDRGIGMTPRTVLDYFLKIGASSRESDEWLKKYVDESGHSSVLRSGRFGVGVLASFLLGDRIEVTTRHVSEKLGVRFDARLEDGLIPLRPVKDARIGTVVRIAAGEKGKLLSDRKQRSTWDYYALDHPLVVRRIEPMGEVLRNDRIPPPGEGAAPDWREASAQGYDGVLWTDETSALYCNGVYVVSSWFKPYPSMYDNTDFAVEGDKSIGPAPGLAVFDPDGKLPLELSRAGLADHDRDLEAAVTKDIFRDYLAFILLTAPEEAIRLDGTPIPPRRFHSMVWPETGGWDHWFFGEEGATQLDVLGKTGYDSVFFTPCVPEDPSTRAKTPALDSALRRGALTGCYCLNGFVHTKNLYTLPNPWPIFHAGWLSNRVRVGGARILLRKGHQSAGRIFIDPDNNVFPVFSDWDNGEWFLATQGESGEPCVDYRHLVESSAASSGDWWVLGVEWHIGRWEPETTLGKLWMEYFQTPWIPLDRQERLRKLAHSFDALAPYIERWRTRLNQNWVRPALRRTRH